MLEPLKMIKLGKNHYFNALSGQFYQGEDILGELGPKDSEVFELLLSKKNEVVTHDELHNEVWKNTIVSDTSLTKAISNIRKVVNQQNIPIEIKTYPKKGYGVLFNEELKIEERLEDEKSHQWSIKKWFIIYSSILSLVLILLEILVLNIFLSYT